MHILINRDQLLHELEILATFSEAPSPAITRIVFSEADRRARSYVKDLCSRAGLELRDDAVGNTFARWPGELPGESAVGTGSHIDAIPNAGRYDGTVGVLGGLEAIRALQRAGFRPRRSIELLIFAAEEPTRFGIGCLGSRLLSGSLGASSGEQLKDKTGKTLNERRAEAGLHGDLTEVRLQPGYYAGFLELHIEQGPLLERDQMPLGIVTAIAAPASLRIVIEGEGGHAGGMLMPDRHDALCAAAELILAVEAAALSSGAVDTVATTGVCEVFPGAVNSVPSRVRLEVDVRDTELDRRERVLAAITQAGTAIAARRRVSIHSETVNADAPARCDEKIVESLARACGSSGLGFERMVSRAYHDSLFISRVAPVGMLFIPCRGGASHRPDEYASPEAIANGTLVLAQALAELAG